MHLPQIANLITGQDTWTSHHLIEILSVPAWRDAYPLILEMISSFFLLKLCHDVSNILKWKAIGSDTGFS